MYYLKKDPLRSSNRTPEEAYKMAYDKAVRDIEKRKTTNAEGKRKAIAALPKEPSATVQQNPTRSPAANLDKYTYEGNGVYRRRGTNDFYDSKNKPISQEVAEKMIFGDPLQDQEEGGDGSTAREPQPRTKKRLCGSH